MGTSDSKQGGFTVTDRRSFAGAEAGKTDDGRRAGARRRAGDSVPRRRTRRAGASRRYRPSTFTPSCCRWAARRCCTSASSSIPRAAPAEKDLPLAKHTIDILSMLEEKTKGNLTSAEEKLIQSLLYDLRLRYVNASK